MSMSWQPKRLRDPFFALVLTTVRDAIDREAEQST
jgi:hypothetical protein